MAVRKRTIIIGVIIAAVVIPIAVYTVSPLFVSKTVNEPTPIVKDINKSSSPFEQFMAMSEQERYEKGQQMSDAQKEAVMKDAAMTPGATVNEAMNDSMTSAQASIVRTGVFVGVNDGIHNAEGNAKVIQLANGAGSVLRLEDFRSTNGPDLYVYLSTDKGASDFVSLGRLKGNIGNQNYEIPNGTDLSKYGMVLVWCKAFSVLFGDAELKPSA
jgi:hypothetical protein